MSLDEQKVWVSPYNLLHDSLGEHSLPRRLGIYDTTLRDGEQTVGLCFDKYEKLEIAKALDALGVDRIEAGMPVVSREDREAVEMIVNAGLRAEVWGFARCVKDDVDACADAGVKAIICEIATSQAKLYAYGLTREKVIDKLVQHLLHAKERGLYTAFFAVDATRTDLDFLEEVYTTAVFAGKADEVVIVDTLGVATPETMAFLTRRLRSWVSVPMSVHCHNDFGLATACTLASIKAGATYAQTTINGLGEKTGNTDVAELVIAAQLLYGLQTGIALEQLQVAARLVEKLSHIPISPLKPVVGENVFKRESGAVIAQLTKYPPSVEGYAPDLVGRQREIVLGKKSGKNSVEFYLEKCNRKRTAEEVDNILQLVKERGTQNKGPVTEADFLAIVEDVSG